jgi:GNAT superfamily N-acetyltransferase
MEVRARTEADLAACRRLAEAVHTHDGYPVYVPDDLLSFIAAPDAIAAWVAVEDNDVVGHVVLRPGTFGAVMDLAMKSTGLPAARLGVIARLLVSPNTRRLGIGQSLLHVAAGHAVELGLRPILDVVDRHEAAIKLYESSGWTRAGMVTVTFGPDVVINEFVFIGPELAR